MTFFQEIGSALEARFRTQVENDAQNDLAGRVQYGGFQPAEAWADKRWARVTFEVATAEMSATNGTSGIHEHAGVLFLEFYDAPGAKGGAGPITEVADRAANAFRLWSTASPQVETMSPRISAPEVDGGWLRILVRIEFQAFETFAHAT